MELLKRFLTGLGAIALVLAVYFGGPEEAQDGANANVLPPELADEPDVYLSEATISEFEPSGELKYRLYADQMNRYDDLALTRLATPRLDLFSDEAPPWEVRAERGVITRAPDEPQDIVRLDEDVVLKQIDPNTGRVRMTLRSETMTVHPHRQYAETDQDVMIDSAVGRTIAQGMTGDLRSGVMSLFSDVSNPTVVSPSESTSSSERVHTIVLPQQFKQE